MPLDGPRAHQPNGWTIKVEPSPFVATQRQQWSQQRRNIYDQIAVEVAYAAITALQKRRLRTCRTSLWHVEGEAFYFFRRDRRAARTILITIFKIDFHTPDCDPDPDPGTGASAPHPLEPLVLDVSGFGRRYSIDYVEGALPLPPRTNRIDRLGFIYTTFNAPVSAHGTVDSAVYCFPPLFGIADKHNFYRGYLRLQAATTRSFAKHSSWKLDELFQHANTPSLGRTAGVVTIFRGMERFAQNPGNGVDITTEVVGATDAQYCLLSPDIASRNSSKICTQQIYPSGLP